MNLLPYIEYPKELPVSQKRDEIIKAIVNNQVVIVAGETGSGKTTQLPKICLELGLGSKGVIGHTQPRRLAARAVASRIAEEMKTKLGDLVGYKVRFAEQLSKSSKIKLMTDGILLAEIASDANLSGYDTLIIDEAHERSLNIDFILGYLKQLLPSRPDLKVIITSATIDQQRFAKHFSQGQNLVPIIEVSGRTYPVETRYRPLWQDEKELDQIDGIINAIDELLSEPLGDILIFLNGEREIRDTAEALHKIELKDTQIISLYARLAFSEQKKIFSSHTGRRIILSTNIAETSLTVPGIKYVIDTGTARISRYSYRTKVQRLPIEPISQSSANQRQGRCGRVSDGICIRLYSKEDFNSRSQFTDPEILRTNLAFVILQMTALGLGDIKQFPFIDPPDQRNIQDGVRLLEELGAFRKLDAKINVKRTKVPSASLTLIGRKLSRLPIDPRLGRMLIEAVRLNCATYVSIIVAALSIADPRERPTEYQQSADDKHKRFFHLDSDFLTWVNLWYYLQKKQQTLSGNRFRKLCKQEFLNYVRVREWQDLFVQLQLSLVEISKIGNAPNSDKAIMHNFDIEQTAGDWQALNLPYDHIHQAILSGLLSHIGNIDLEKKEYLGAHNRHFHIFPASGQFKKQPKWIIAAELVETSKLWGRGIAKIQSAWIESLAKHLVKRSYSEPHWSKKQAAVMAYEKITLYGVPIVVNRKVNYGNIDPVLSREIFIRSALVEGLWETKHKFFAHNKKLLQEIELLEHKSRRRDLMVTDEQLFMFYDQKVGSKVVSTRHFDTWWQKVEKIEPLLLNFSHGFLLQNDISYITTKDYPDFWYQNDLKLKLNYNFNFGEQKNNLAKKESKLSDGVTVDIPIAILNQIQKTGFDWQIPALRKELVINLIKSLPKTLRKNFVPAPNYAQVFLERAYTENVTAQVPYTDLSLLDALEKLLFKITGVKINREDWRLDTIASHLHITFRVINHKGRVLKTSKHLHELKNELQDEVQQTLAHVANNDIVQQDLHTWSFGSLEQVYEQQKAGYNIKAYLAIVDNKDSVAIKLYETKEQQLYAMQAGLRRLILLNVPSPIKYLHTHLPNKSKLGLYFNPYGKVLDLIDDCIACAVDKLIATSSISKKDGMVWDKLSFESLKEYVRAELGQCVLEIAMQVEEILTLVFEINKKLKGKIDLSLAFALSDIKAQLEQLIFSGFATKATWRRLPDILRYVQAIVRRIEKLALDPNKDRLHMLKIEDVTKSYKQLLAKKQNMILPQEVIDIRWMIEELRVSFFAQQLGTPYPISEKRIKNAIDAC